MQSALQALAGLQLAKAFEVEEVPDLEYEVTVYEPVKDKDGKHLSFKTRKETRKGGFMVYFPAGHSIHVRDEKTLAELGLSEDAGLVDLESGEAVPAGFLSIKSVVSTKTRQRAMRN